MKNTKFETRNVNLDKSEAPMIKLSDEQLALITGGGIVDFPDWSFDGSS